MTFVPDASLGVNDKNKSKIAKIFLCNDVRYETLKYLICTCYLDPLLQIWIPITLIPSPQMSPLFVLFMMTFDLHSVVISLLPLIGE